MTDLAHAIANQAPEPPALPTPQDETLLPLSGAGPFNPVYVKISGSAAEFSYGTLQGYSDLEWFVPKGTTSNGSITFVFTTPTITKMESKTTGLTFSAVTQPGANKQQTASVLPSGGPYHFNISVVTTAGTVVVLDIDPKIVVTPL